jgi:hypothetical protein
MATNYLSATYLDFLDYLIDKATPEEILAYQASEKEEQRASELLQKNNAGTLTQAEAEELEQMLEVDRLVSVLKARALEALHRRS